jgi:hypothetical protein
MNSRRRITAPEAQDQGIVSRQTSGLEGVGGEDANVRFGSKADIATPPTNVRFTPKSGHYRSANKCPLCAKSRHDIARRMHLSAE